jgi:DNA-binding response OmpR family regulator
MLRGLRQIEPGLKSIIITGLGEENRIAEAKAAGADLILNKPFAADQLLALVKQLLARPDEAQLSFPDQPVQ